MFLLVLVSLICGFDCSFYNYNYKNVNKIQFLNTLDENSSRIFGQDDHYDLLISDKIISSKLKYFWKSSGLCPPDPHQESYKFLLSADMKQNLFLIGSLPHNGIKQVRVHWMLDLVHLRVLPSMEILYNFSYLDELVYLLWENKLQPGFELMGNPSNFFTDFENGTQVYMWKDLIQVLAEHYIDIYGIAYVMTWNFETWNEPDHQDFDGLNFTIQGFLNYYDACSEGLYHADKRLRFGGPGGSCRVPTAGKSPICWALLAHCIDGKNFFTGETGVRLDFISFHKKGNSSSLLILDEEIETIKYIKSYFSSLSHLPFYNDEADPLKNWSLPQWWRADSVYAAMVVKIILSHIYFYYVKSEPEGFRDTYFGLLSNDNAFLSFFPNQFTQRTLLARFQVNNTQPNYTQFIRKPVYSVFGLLSKLCPNILHIQIFNYNKIPVDFKNEFGAIATQCDSHKEIVIILYNSADIIPNATTADVHITVNISNQVFTSPRWAVLEVNNKKTNPFLIWKNLGMPAFPTIQEFAQIKEKEEPSVKGPFSVKQLETFQFHLKILNPGVTLLNICGREKAPKQVRYIRFLQIWNQTLQISWQDKFNRCILTYVLLYSHCQYGPFYQLNKKKIIYPSYWYSCTSSSYNCQIKGFYKVYTVDYWGVSGPDSDIFYFNG